MCFIYQAVSQLMCLLSSLDRPLHTGTHKQELRFTSLQHSQTYPTKRPATRFLSPVGSQPMTSATNHVIRGNTFVIPIDEA